jgi:hypothetical protein
MSQLSGWHVDKRVSIGHIVTTLVVAVSAVMWMSRIENKVDLNAQMIAVHSQQIRETGQNVTDGFNDIKTDLRSMWVELRRINERLGDKADR